MAARRGRAPTKTAAKKYFEAIGFLPFVVLEGTWCIVAVIFLARPPRPTPETL